MATQNHMRLIGQAGQPVAGLEPITNRVGIGLCGIDAYIGADRRQNLITRQNQIVTLTPQSGMLGGMTIANLYNPVAACQM